MRSEDDLREVIHRVTAIAIAIAKQTTMKTMKHPGRDRAPERPASRIPIGTLIALSI